MSERNFYQRLSKGLGSAILDIKANPSSEEYKEIVLRFCLRDLFYDWQAEGTKGDYLYTAICALKEKEYFEKIVVKKFLSHCPDHLFMQLADILFCYAEDGSEIAKAAFYTKYDYFLNKTRKFAKSFRLDEDFQWDYVTKHLFGIGGFTIFKSHAINMGGMLQNKPENKNTYYYGDFISESEKIFGKKRTVNFLEKMYGKSSAIKVLVDTLHEEKMERKQYAADFEREKITINSLLEIAQETASREVMHFGAIMRYRYSFFEKASGAEILTLANSILEEENETAKGLLLRIFSKRQFPLGFEPLLEYARSENKILSENALYLLEEFKGKKIHDLAILLLQKQGLDSHALGLLKKNYRKTDDEIIYKLIKKTTSIPHHVLVDIRMIYNRYYSNKAFPILFHTYLYGQCTYCRYGIVKAMKSCRVLPDDILEECLHDSYFETRKLAQKLQKVKKS